MSNLITTFWDCPSTTPGRFCLLSFISIYLWFQELLQCVFRLRFPNGRHDGLAGYEPFELLLGHFHDLLFGTGPLIPAIQKSLVEQQKTVTLPDEALDFVRFSAAEHEQDILLEWGDSKLPSDNSGQASLPWRRSV